MRNIKMTVEYDGTSYHGFQKQAGQNLPTIQEALEKALRKLTGEEISVTGAGRTDAGVHALGQVINFYTESSIPTGNFVRALNSVLPEDIVAKDAVEAPGDFHAQFWAKKKTYRYTIFNDTVPSVFYRRYSLFVPYKLNVDNMRKAASFLVGQHDFSAFRAAGSTARSSIRTMYRAEVEQEGELIHVYLEANGFLYNMVRIITGTLLYIGQGKLRVEEMKDIIASGDRTLAGPTVPPQGLCLMRVEY